MKEYDEDEVLTRYVWHNYRNLMTRVESLGEKAVVLEAKAQSAEEGSRMRRRMEEKAELARTDRRVARALAEGPERFRRAVRDRLLRDRASKIDLNRCPRCDRIPRTPRAKQCPWCFYSWR